MTFEDCLGKGLIKKSDSSAQRIEQSLLLGDKFLKSAKKNMDIDEFEVCEIIAYNSIFHYSRALLFAKGYIERSHACLFLALQQLYPEQKESINKADKIRAERHNLQYFGFSASGSSATFVVNFASEYAKTVKNILKGKM